MVERRVLDLKDSDDRVEGATIADVTEFRVLDVIGGRALRLGNGDDIGRRHVDELGKRIDEATDQPWARDAVDLGMFARDPFVFDGAEVLARRQAGCSPSRDAAL